MSDDLTEADKFLHPAYLLKEGTVRILEAAFGMERTLFVSQAIDHANCVTGIAPSVLLLAKQLAFASYTSHVYRNSPAIGFTADGDDDAAIAMMTAARWMGHSGTVTYTYGGMHPAITVNCHVNDDWARDGEFTCQQRQDMFHPDFNPVQLLYMRKHYADSSQLLRDYGFDGDIPQLAHLAGKPWERTFESMIR